MNTCFVSVLRMRFKGDRCGQEKGRENKKKGYSGGLKRGEEEKLGKGGYEVAEVIKVRPIKHKLSEARSSDL